MPSDLSPRSNVGFLVLLVTLIVTGSVYALYEAEPAALGAVSQSVDPSRSDSVTVLVENERAKQSSAQPAWPGMIIADELRLAPSASGTLARVEVRRGERVREGALLFELESHREREILGGLLARLKGARADVSEAEQALERLRPLFQDGAATRERFDEARDAAEAARTRVEELTRQTTLAQAALDRRVVVAPVDGLVYDLHLAPGEYAREGDAVVTLLPVRERSVRFFFPADRLSEIELGQTVTVRLHGSVEPVLARIDFVSAAVEMMPDWASVEGSAQSISVFRAEAALSAGQASELRPGSQVRVVPIADDAPMFRRLREIEQQRAARAQDPET